MSANTLYWKSLPQVVKIFEKLPIHYHSSLKQIPTMHLSRMIVDSAILLVDNANDPEIQNVEGQNIINFLINYLNELLNVEKKIPGIFIKYYFNTKNMKKKIKLQN